MKPISDFIMGNLSLLIQIWMITFSVVLVVMLKDKAKETLNKMRREEE